jgi:hypothetical protein
MINVWEQKRVRKSDKIYYKNILTNESTFDLPSQRNGKWKKLKDKYNNIYLMYIPILDRRSMIIEAGLDDFDYSNMTLQLYNQQNPDYQLETLPPNNPYLLKDWMDRPFRTSDQLRAFWVFRKYNQELVYDWHWTRIMNHMRQRLLLSYTDLDNFYIDFYINLRLNDGNLYETMHFLSEPVPPFLPTDSNERDEFLRETHRSSQQLLAYWIHKNYNPEMTEAWPQLMEILNERGVNSYNALDQLYESSEDLQINAPRFFSRAAMFWLRDA